MRPAIAKGCTSLAKMLTRNNWCNTASGIGQSPTLVKARVIYPGEDQICSRGQAIIAATSHSTK